MYFLINSSCLWLLYAAKNEHRSYFWRMNLTEDLKYLDVGITGTTPVHGHQAVALTQSQSAVDMSVNTEQINQLSW